MNLAIDIGNSITHIAVYSSGKIVYLRKIPSSVYTADKFLKDIEPKIKRNVSISGIASVVPEINKKWIELLRRTFTVEPVLINNKIPLPVRLKVKNPDKLGADRICNAAAGYEYFKNKENVIAADFGTAVTIDVVLKNGDFIGGIISPGITTMAKSLNDYTSRLPLLKSRDYIMPGKIIGKNTVEAIRSGTIFASLASFEGIIREIEKERKAKFKIIITGGFSRYIHSNTKLKTVIRENLVLDGINNILEFNYGN